MKFFRAIPALALAAVMSACSSTKDITYFQDFTPGYENTITGASPIRLRPNDKISIVVSTSDPRLNMLFNLPVTYNRLGNTSSSGTSSGNGDISPYTVDKQGDINFPVIGKLHVAGMNREELAEYVRRELVSRDLVKNPIVTVEYLNLGVSVMGEVKNPGRVEIPREDFTLLDALSATGDLTIYGRRDNIRVIRDEDGVQKVYFINLNSGKDLAQSPVYYLRQNDVIYVEPNATKARQSTANGNAILTPTFWISIASFATTIALIFIK